MMEGTQQRKARNIDVRDKQKERIDNCSELRNYKKKSKEKSNQKY